jgi:3-(3-hydroxy-phenyl)propionate hydroxylase
MKHYDVLIVGCGPVGATLANFLRLKGYRAAIFDRDKAVFRAPRAMQIDAESCRIFQELGIQQRLEGVDARPANRHVFVDGNRKPLMELKSDIVEGPLGYPAGTRFHQPALERLLREDFELGDEIDAYYGYEVLEVDGEGETATLKALNTDSGEQSEFSGRYIVGSDGGSSLCRKYIGADRIDFDYSRLWIVMDLIVHDQNVWDSLIDRSEFRCRPDAAVVFVKGCNNHVRFDFEVIDEVARTFNEDDAIKLVSEYFDTGSVEFIRVAPYHFYAGMPATWRKGRVLLAGDAAHLTSPFSGQGLNMGIRDAANLAFKMDMVFRGCVSDKFVDTYEQERWKNCEYNIKGATARGLMISRRTVIGKFKRNISFFVGQHMPSLALKMTQKMNNVVPYASGLVGGHDLAGRSSIQPRVETPEGDQVLLDHVTGNGFVLLQSAPVDSEEADWFGKVLGGAAFVVGRDFKDLDGKLAAFFNKHNVTQVLVRPDRFIFDAGDSNTDLRAQLKAALDAYA